MPILKVWALAIVIAAMAQPMNTTVTHPHLVATCVNGHVVNPADRSWRLSTKTSFVFTMLNAPRTGIAMRDPGLARIAFTPERGHLYEIEVRSDPTAFSQRVWEHGKWTPVVRDRTTDTLV